jgi:hypothetical protein
MHCNLLELFHLLFDYFLNKKITNEAIVGWRSAYDNENFDRRFLRQTAGNVRIRLQLMWLRAARGIRAALPQVSLKSLLRQALPTQHANYGVAFYKPWLS